MTLNELLNFNPQTLIDNPALIQSHRASLQGSAIFENTGNGWEVYVSVEIKLGREVWIMHITVEQAIAFLDKCDTTPELIVAATIGKFTVL